MSTKESILDAIRRLPDDVAFDDVVEEIRILQRIQEGEQAADEGKTRRHEEVRELVRSWALG